MSGKNAGHSISEATRSRARFSGHGNAKGDAGYISYHDENQECSFLSRPGETAIVNPNKDGTVGDFEIGVAWDNIEEEERKKKGFLSKIIKPKILTGAKKKGIDLDLGCLYELKNGQRGAIQAFGETFGSFDEPPYIQLSGDERTGDKEGHDEVITVNGKHWNDIKRLLVYIYIYDGASNWDFVKPQIQVLVPGEEPMIVTLRAKKQEMVLCAVAELENVRGGIRMTNRMEYYPGHPAMDRAFGYGLEWDDGKKRDL